MIKAVVINDKERLSEFYRLRYDVFVVEQGAAPTSFYPDKELKDDFDEQGIHIGCYMNDELVGTISFIHKEQHEALMVEKVHHLKSDSSKNYAEVMRFIVVENAKTKKFGVKGLIVNKLLGKLYEVLQQYKIDYVYVQSCESVQTLYESIGFKQIGEYQLYEGISNECPMVLDMKAINQNILEGVK
ncbi:N-acyl amino acid synthase FeeM domain-containing protein [Shouchella patagoniensis]|uniref:N-acyl amino acid synthase FeeM domain-containing protein n=1 Tax=Shouchella patagoniensis TaxID=228576 RepID=UPI001474A159|nr:GNAT family N-acyltransferase [Shouchella patagoniensis]